MRKGQRKASHASPPRVRVQGSSDAIAKLKKMNTSLQKSYHNESSVHNQPFIPSSTTMKNPLSPNSPNSKHKYWYGVERSQDSPRRREGDAYDAFYADSSPPSRVRASEYDDRFVAMKLPEKPPRSPERQLTSLNSFLVDANSSTWKSEQHDNFRKMPIGSQPVKVAGVSTRDKDTYPTSFAWKLSDKNSELNKTDPSSTKGDHVDERDVNQPTSNNDRMSEHDQKFQWPPSAERVIYTNPDKQYTPFPKDVAHINAVNWKSEYDDVNTQLVSNKLTPSDTAAGVANPKDDKANPSFYAWEDSTVNRPVPPEINDLKYPFNYKMGSSEYKNKFKEWPVEASRDEDRVSRDRPTSTHVFPPSAESDYAELRQTSSHKSDYPKYSDPDVVSSAANIPVVREKLPISFAWSTLEKENSEYVPPLRQRRTNGDMEETEYTRKFHWPAQDVLQHPVHRRDSTSSADMQSTLAHGHIGAESSKELKSEYQKQYIDKQNEFISSPSLSPSKSRGNANPPQFAWSLVNGHPIQYDGDNDGKAKPRKLLVNDKELSEHTAKFRWPVDNQSVHGQKPVDEMGKHGSIYAVDPDDLNAGKWQTEYDEQCATLRKKQQALKSSMVAGRPTGARDPVPVNFAWDPSTMPPPPPPSATAAAASYKPRHAHPEHFHSEYEEKFLPWFMEKNEAVRHEGEKLNLFAEDQSAATGAVPSKAMKSEFESQYQPKDGLVADHVRFKAHRDENIPPQFAWPLDTESLPKPPPKPVKPTPPLEKSEYESNFTWQTAPPFKSVKRTNCEPPIPVDDDQPESLWKTEYDANSEGAVTVAKGGKFSSQPAGLIGLRAEDVPSFFAWADAEEKKPVVLPQPAFPAEVVPTEYQEQFQSSGLTLEDKPKRFKEPQNPDWFHLESGNGTFTTEYDSNFKWKTGQVNSRFQDSAAGTIGHQTSAPHQFAWGLLDGNKPRPKSAPPRTSRVPFKESTEYESKFNWTSEDYKQPRQSAKSNQIDHFQAAATLDFNPAKDDVTSQWESEYDDRCEQLRKRQQEVCLDTLNSAAQTVSNMRIAAEGSAPPFFAWQDVNKETQVFAEERKSRRPQIPTETTEYREKFSTNRPSTPTNLRGDSGVFGGTHLTVSRQKFEGQSEYDAKFASSSDITSDALNQWGLHRSIMREKQQQPSLRNTILDLESYQPVSARVKSSPSRRSAQQNFATEQSDRYIWPEAKQTQQSFENASTQKHIMRSTASLSTILPGGIVSQAIASKTAAIPLTETQQKFSWPDPAKLSQHEPQLSPRKKSMMKTALQNGVKRYSLMKKSPSPNVYRKDRTASTSQLHNNTFSRSQQMNPSVHYKSSSGRNDHDESFSIPSDLRHPHSVGDDSNRLAATTGTVMSQDSLYVPPPSAAQGSRAGISSRNSSTNAKTNETLEPSSPVSVAESATLESKTAKTDSDIARKEIFTRDNSPIRGLRAETDLYRSRSAPPKQRLGQVLNSDTGVKYRVYRDESPSNPVLMYRRYPGVTDRQATRWSTETRDSFKWRNTRSASPLK